MIFLNRLYFFLIFYLINSSNSYRSPGYGVTTSLHHPGVKNGHFKSMTKTHGHYHTSSHEDISSSSLYHDMINYKDVLQPPEKACSDNLSAVNSIIQCSSQSKCTAKCIDGHQFPNGDTQLTIQCIEGEWEIHGSEWSNIPPCQPVCLPHCQNNGICIAPGRCNCPQNFEGPQCQYKKEPCLSFPPAPMNGRRNCTSKVCHLSCVDGHKFEDGSKIINLNCQNGKWIPNNNAIASPKCIPQCSPPCMNGGMCLSLNVCQCPQEFRGPQCQYSVDVCNVRKLGFNGAYKCSGSATEFSCSLSCPSGIKFNAPPTKLYICAYETGQYLPQPIPQCLYSKDHIITTSQSSQHSYTLEHLHSNNYGKIDITGGTYDSAIHFPGQDSEYIFSNKSSFDTQKINDEEELIAFVNLPKPGICISWGDAHFKTFDGLVYSYESVCRHILVRDSWNKLFTITIQKTKNQTEILVFLQDKEYILRGTDDGGVIFKSVKNLLPIPAQLPGLRVEMAGHMVQLTLETLGVNLKWDTKRFVQIEASESLWNRTEGMCGVFDGSSANDIRLKDRNKPVTLASLASAWQLKKLGDEQCLDQMVEKYACDKQTPEINLKAENFCKKLISDARFSKCRKIMDISRLLDTCKWDYCQCSESPESCACDSLSVYATHCVLNGVKSLINWRDQDICMMNCTGGRIYKSCGPPIQISCGSALPIEDNNNPKSLLTSKSCTEGCFCPTDTIFYKGKCISKEQCPCRFRGKMFHPGSSVAKDCNTCTCQNGEWVCTQILCGARCSIRGDPHYQTFDGTFFDFMGTCSYYLMKGSNYSIEAENVACSGAIDYDYELNPSAHLGTPSCTKSILLKYGDTVMQLKQNKMVVLNGKEVTRLPIRSKGIKVKIASSLFIMAEMDNGLIIWWNGITNAFIDVPPKFRGNTKGLCGTFNANQNDDFLTPENDVEQSVIPFANKWKTDEKCDNIKPSDHPCEKNMQNKPQAEKYCSKLTGKLFEECHGEINVQPFYENCLYDMCACSGPIEKCLCPMLASYAAECSYHGINIEWRLNIKECEVQCSEGQVYQVCGDSCTRSCLDLTAHYEDELNPADEPTCHAKCVEGCNCPPGKSLNSEGICIPIGACPCYHDGIEFPSHYKEVRPGLKQQELCECVAAKWNCKPASPEDIIQYPRALDIKDKCSAVNHEEFTTCEPIKPVTCKNMNKNVETDSTDAECRPGCKCVKGYVFDSTSKKCIKPENCPCHHGGKSYADGQSMQESCNVCKCIRGKWNCEDRVCDGVCSTWGDSHYTTFDGKSYDFQGVCSYLLAKGQLDSKDNSFSVEIQNEICGTAGVTCSKAIILKVGDGENMESITFSKNIPLPDNNELKKIQLRNAGLFTYAEIESLGIVVQWDKGTRVYVRADPSWKGKIKGLCGNYNDNQADDFQTPSGGISETSPLLFGDSWKLQAHCPPAYEMQDTCALYPERKLWASQQCGILKRVPFSNCHTEVPPEKYLERCERDTCACGNGGDCECLCTALAAYAHACAARGVPIKWRTQELCPMQCDETCTNYSPCMSSCPLETCDNTLKYQQVAKLCQKDNCIEGCEHKRPCKVDEIYSNSSFEECIPRSTCKPICMILSDGTKILEGEILVQDDCQVCHCSRGKKICQGQPCSPAIPIETTTLRGLNEEKLKCKSGWSDWINLHIPEHVKNTAGTKSSKKPYSVETEKLPTEQYLISLGGPICSPENITEIECRTVDGLLSVKDANIDAECSLEKGLFCRQPKEKPCPDFEIRVYCQCKKPKHISKPIYEPEKLIRYECEPSRPNIEHPNDCALFYQCAVGMGPPEHPNLVEKSCGDNMLYNPDTMICDWPESVIALKPECGGTTSKTHIIHNVIEEKDVFVFATTPHYSLEVFSPQMYKRPHCPPELLGPILCGDQPISNEAFTASSFKGPSFLPQKSKLQNYPSEDMNDCWEPEVSDNDQYIQVSLEDKAQNVYGIITQGNPSSNDFVTSYQVEYSKNGFDFYPIENDNGKQMIFDGPPDHKTLSKHLFDEPIFAKSVRIKPLTWHGSIAIKFELLGCNQSSYYENTVFQTTPPSFFTTFNTIGFGKCEPGQIWSDCMFNCDKICNYYLYELRQKGICANNEKCIPGCEDTIINKNLCKNNLYLRGPNSCVNIADCPCNSFKGKIVKPGEVVQEESCEVCQCINNKYTCDSSLCKKEIKKTNTTTIPEPPRTGKTRKLSPPPNCSSDLLKPILSEKISQGDAEFIASSSLSLAFRPENAKLNEGISENSGGCWTPKSSSSNEFIGVKFTRKEPIYGIIIQGSSLFDQYITSYSISYGDDENMKYSVHGYGNPPEVFQGPVNNIEPVKQIFNPPIEAKYIKLNPLTWHDTISVKMELLGCSSEPQPQKYLENKCHLPLQESSLPIEHITVSSQKPNHAKENCDINSNDAWEPLTQSPAEWIQLEFSKVFNFTNIITKGGPDGWVKSYSMKYSPNGVVWNDIYDENKKPKVFLGNFDHNTPTKSKFNIPLRAKYLRVLPLTWANCPQLRVDLVGCALPQVKLFECKKPNTLMPLPIETVTSSSKNPEFININKNNAWQPLETDKEKWIQFDYAKPHNIVGLEIKGGPDGWVTSFSIKYSPDSSNWFSINDVDDKIKNFAGNTDKLSLKQNLFVKPIQMKNLKLFVKDWKNKPQMKAQPLVCEEKPITKEEYHEVGSVSEPEIISEVEMPSTHCEICPGIDILKSNCECSPPMAFDGHNCIPRVQCPCMVGHIPYAVGATYEVDNCDTCVCILGGVSDCKKKQCPKCKNGLIAITSKICECICTTCPEGKKACPTNNVCIPETQWCDGVQDCPDDETDCEIKPKITTTIPPPTEKTCPIPSCPTGYKIVEKPKLYKNLELTNDEFASDSLFRQSVKSSPKSYMRYYKGGTKSNSPSSGLKSNVKLSPAYSSRKVLETPSKAKLVEECEQWNCVSTKSPPPLIRRNTTRGLPSCLAPQCPPGYIVITETEQTSEYDCPKYSCSPPPRKDAVCNVTCRMFNTFDGIEYQYDICNHILARDAVANMWDITIQKNCSKKVCVNELLISQENEQVRFRPDLTIEYNGYSYTVDQTRKIGFKTNTFVISRLGDTLFFISKLHGFWVIYDNKGDAKIGVAGKLYGKVDGLCGYFNENPDDDRRKPDGSLVLSTEDFGDSWAHKNNDLLCRVRACPINLQNKAWEICKAYNDPSFEKCKTVLDTDKYHARCFESVCDCLQADNVDNMSSDIKEQQCLCNSLQNFVTDCLAADQSINTQGWRTKMKCPISCPPSLVHYDCFRRRCELSCSTYMQDIDSCPVTPGVCFSGCFCPEGSVRKGDTCLPPTDCRDCVCDGFGKPEYVTFDRRNFTFNGNCSYIAARDKMQDNKHAFEVFVTNGDCPNDPNSICTVALHVIYENHTIHIEKLKNQLQTTVDGLKIIHYPMKKKWINIQLVSGNDINLIIPSVQLELSSVFKNLAFSIRVPSILYGNKTEGLCGNCDGDDRNDFMPSNDPRKHGLNWRAKAANLEMLGLEEGKCVEKPKNECWPLPPDDDPCLKMLDPAKFGKCHAVIDPTPYITSCQQDLCTVSKQLGVCEGFEAYTRECRRAGICLDWRQKDFCPYKCKNDLIYKPCGLGCQVTCENYEVYKMKPSTCNAPKNEGCFCPEGKVLVNETCIPFSKCFPCDSAGHYVGDKWQMDECTECSCSKRGGGVSCVEKSCSVAVSCGNGFVSQQIAKPPGQCCPEFICVPEPTDIPAQCEEPTKIKCGFGQMMKLDTMSNKCQQFICVCVPANECEFLEEKISTILQPGMEKIIDETGCCPRSKFVCNPDKCPEPPKCSKYYQVKKTKSEDQCCPTFTCEPPFDKCLYKMEYESSPLGGEFKRKPENIETVLKTIGSSWQDGPCRSCTCKNTNEGIKTNSKTVPRAVCSVTQCPPIPTSDDFIIESVGVPFACCQEAKYSVCKHRDTVFKVGEELKSATNSCISYVCIEKNDGTLEKRMNIKQCDKKCKPGLKYVPPTSDNICCGECVPDACIVGGKEYKIGQEWTSKDFCTNYFCINKNGTLQVQAVSVSCPPISKAMREEFEIEEIVIEGKCCKKIKPVACKINGKIYKIGEEWMSATNSCISYSCKYKNDGQIEKHTNVKQCQTKCKPGYKYVESKNPQICCGECVAKACVVNNIEHEINKQWTSEDFCTKYKCSNINGNLIVETDTITCPSNMKLKEDFLIEEMKVDNFCCKKIKYTGCKINGTVYKIGEQWKSAENACISFICAQKGDQTLEKRTNVKQCDTKCKQGFKYVQPKNPTSTCCGECVPFACIVDGKEYPIGKTWTSADFCTNYLCVHKNGTLQVQAVNVACPQIPANLHEEFLIVEKPVEGKCCKDIKAMACKNNGEIYGVGSSWSSGSDPCKNITCTHDANEKLIKQETVESCNDKCAPGWEYKPSSNPNICCGKCIQKGCLVENELYEEGDKWFSTDGCTKYACEKKDDNYLVSAYEKSCPDLSNCEPSHIYTKGCCKYCNVTSLCIAESLPPEETIGMIQQLKPPHGVCYNKQPLQGFNECKGSCNSGSIYNKETGSHDSSCKCCQATKYNGIVIDLTCKDGFKFQKQVAIPVSCDCRACAGATVKSHTKSKSYSSAFIGQQSDLDDVEMIDPKSLNSN